MCQLYALNGAGSRGLFGGEEARRRGVETSDGGTARRPAPSTFRLRGPDRPYPIVATCPLHRWRFAVAGQTVRGGPNPNGRIPYLVAPNTPRPHAFWGERDLFDLNDVCLELNA